MPLPGEVNTKSFFCWNDPFLLERKNRAVLMKTLEITAVFMYNKINHIVFY